jgi:hypothetical protein
MCKQVGIEALPSPMPTSSYQSAKVKRQFIFKEAFFYGAFVLGGR